MIELPRNPSHILLDDLCEKGREILRSTRSSHEPAAQVYQRVSSEVLETLAGFGFIQVTDAKNGVTIFHPTFEGLLMGEHLRIGYYEHCKELYRARAARDAAIMNNPLWGQF